MAEALRTDWVASANQCSSKPSGSSGSGSGKSGLKTGVGGAGWVMSLS
jgi:hypothetical protein